jgi:hypothetical protein
MAFMITKDRFHCAHCGRSVIVLETTSFFVSEGQGFDPSEVAAMGFDIMDIKEDSEACHAVCHGKHFATMIPHRLIPQFKVGEIPAFDAEGNANEITFDQRPTPQPTLAAEPARLEDKPAEPKPKKKVRSRKRKSPELQTGL